MMKKIAILTVFIFGTVLLIAFFFFLQNQSGNPIEPIAEPERQIADTTNNPTLPNISSEDLPEVPPEGSLDARKAGIALSNFDVRKYLGISEAFELTRESLFTALNNERLYDHHMRLLLFAAYLLEPDEARPMIMDFVTRDEDPKRYINGTADLSGKAWAIRSLGIVGDEESRDILLKATTLEGAKELTKNWTAFKYPRYESDYAHYIAFLRSSAVEGLAFANYPEDRDFIMRVYEHLSAIENTEGEAARNALISQEEEELIGYDMVIAARAYLDIIDEIGRDAFIDSFLGDKKGFPDNLFFEIVDYARD